VLTILAKTSRTNDMEKKGSYSDGPNEWRSNLWWSKSTQFAV